MADYNLIIQPEAEADLDEAYDYLEAQKAGLGFEFLASLTDVTTLIEEAPEIYPEIYGDKRRAILKKFKYNIIYKIKGMDIYILAIMHSSRDPRRWQGR